MKNNKLVLRMFFRFVLLFLLHFMANKRYAIKQ